MLNYINIKNIKKVYTNQNILYFVTMTKLEGKKFITKQDNSIINDDDDKSLDLVICILDVNLFRRREWIAVF